MKDEVKYFSTDKMYTIKKKNIEPTKLVVYTLIILTLCFLIIGVFFLIKSFNLSGEKEEVQYSEQGKADYTVYLKENSYYESKYLGSGMQYVASLINTINTDFNYEIHSDKNLDFKYNYKIIGTLQIMDKMDSSKILYSKDNILLKEQTEETNSNNIVINKNVIIDYDEYNNYVNSYKREYGLTANSQLVVTMLINVEGVYEEGIEELNKSSKLQITIPLSEQTLNIPINTANIDNSGMLASRQGFGIKSINKLLCGTVLLIIGIIGSLFSRKLYLEYKKENIYTITVNKILREYDRLIVKGNISIQEDKYTNIIRPENFIEMVDASQNLKAPILFYEVLPGEKCFFVIVNGDTLYKYRLTKAYLEREELEKHQQKID